jgi:hypothetical protein
MELEQNFPKVLVNPFYAISHHRTYKLFSSAEILINGNI